ncbi:dihydrofolate reductase [Paecilomyces variotii No. 5]|uniref:Dihydrofolate reductase n=1 Tax=Byssochlamys spectabilis (strain No. 5 / NBRC 109023) TaxID=1356009 RepID=V5FKC2_BYSSN|nr:dihydrofolate reductase [Paecilomyces variotii No. 5]
MTPKQPLKILMLHGYTQSGTLFYNKTRALAKHLQKSFPFHDVSFSYPTGPLRLNPADIPGYDASSDDQTEIEAYGWWRRSNTSDPPEYLGLETGLDSVAKVLRTEGPFDGVIGFSQGAALAAMVASLLEQPSRKEAFAYFSAAMTGVKGIAFPESFESDVVSHPPLKFALCYSGFRAPGPRYRGFYEHPPIQTPVLHVLGSLDSVVEESRSRALIEACAGEPEKEAKVVWHPGGHFLPSQRTYLDAAVLFIRKCLEGQTEKGKEAEESVEDMDVPF